MKRTLLFLCLTNVVVFAQKKDFDEKELKSGKAPKNFTQQLPTFGRWIDDEKIVITQKASPDEAMKPVVLELVSGKTTEATPEIINPSCGPTAW